MNSPTHPADKSYLLGLENQAAMKEFPDDSEMELLLRYKNRDYCPQE
jgi:hypothetical protein